MNFKFTNEYSVSRLDEIVSYLLGPRLWIPQYDYPDFLDWADKAYRELRKESKRAIVAFSHGNVVGVSVYQRHKKDSNALEIKNLTVRPDQRGRYIASFLLRNTEIEGGDDFNSQYVICDAKADNLAVKLFLLKHRYSIVGHQDLYKHESGEDCIYKKELVRFDQLKRCNHNNIDI